MALYSYKEAANEQGGARNDGLEGLAYAGSPGRFYFAEEGTRDCAGNRDALLFFCDPRLGRARLTDGRVVVEEPISERLTDAVRGLRKGSSQTLNALCVLKDGRALAVDRNGGLLLSIDPVGHTAAKLADLYDLNGVSLRALLADFPGPRRMPYVSIEGIAVDDAGTVWLVDDPAIPEPFRNSCLIRINGLQRELAARPAESAPDSRPR